MINIDLPGKLRDIAERAFTSEGRINDGLALFEDWRKEQSSVIDPEKWVVSGASTGGITRTVGSDATTPKMYMRLSGPANADTMRLRSRRRWDVGPDTWGTATVFRKLILEWEVKFATVASIDNTVFFMGLGATTTCSRASDNLIGFILTADALNSITDDAVGETINALGAPVLTNLHKIRMEISAGKVDFFVDETLQATHIANLPDQAMYLHFYLVQEAAANGATVDISNIAAWYEGLPAPIMAYSAPSSGYLKALLARGMIVMQATCNTNMAASTTTLVSDDLSGYTDDYFNNHFYAWVIKNASVVGAAPDGEKKLITDYASATGTFTTNAFSANVEASDVFLVVHESLIDILVNVEAIYDIVNAMLVTSETGGTLTTDGTEQNVYVNNIPAGVFKPLILKLDCTNMAAGDAVTLRSYDRITSTGNSRLRETKNLNGAQSPPIRDIVLYPNRHGVRTTIQRIAGAGDRSYDWEVLIDQ